MEENKKISIFRLTKDIFQNFFKLLGDIRNLASLEAQLARESLAKIIVLGIFATVLSLSTWACVIGLAIAVLLHFGFNLMAAFGIVIAVNMIISGILAAVIFKLKDNLLFTATRRQIRHTRTLLKGS